MDGTKKDFHSIMQEITSGLSGDAEKDLVYLQEKCEEYKDHELGKEIVRACGRLIYDRLPEEKKEDCATAVQKDEFTTKVILEEVKFNIYSVS